MMRDYKRYVKNPTHLEGYIVEHYVVEESIMYCMEHMPYGSKGSYKRGKKRFMDDTGELTNEKPLNKEGVYRLSNVQYEQNNISFCGFFDSYKMKRFLPSRDLLMVPTSKRFRITHTKPMDMCFLLLNGTLTRHPTQNSGIKMNAMTNVRASAKDKKLVYDDTTYYGLIRQILELNYFDFTITIFCCDWVCVEDKVIGCYTDPDINLIFVDLSKFKGSSKIVDEPFILASQASQVFYCKDLTRIGWNVVLHAQKRMNGDIYGCV
ncbi:hypothetical protein IFM89_000282 [Coptis chinensis]|uniref:DUF4216 domain-containing protein n=1 Tax=Coptis chinensis TaxID=261450 RepID=A0A835H9S1_9MAGN|nr:hypothetical protein IFM89_000282 [Coptis chinensis]